MNVQTIVDYAWLFVQVLGALAAFLLVVACVVRWPGGGLALSAAMPIIAWEFPQAPRLADVVGFSIYLDDVFVAILAVALIVNLVRLRVRLHSVHYALFALLFSLTASFIAAFGMYDLGAVVVEARGYFFVVIATLWGLSVVWTDDSANLSARRSVVLRFSLFIGTALMIAALYHGARYGLGAADTFVFGDDGLAIQTSRILTAGQALMLAVSGMALLSLAPNHWRRGAAVFAVACFVVVLASQQRTAALALAIGLIVIFLRTRARQRASALAMLLVVGVLGVVVYVTGVLGGFATQLSQSATSDGTYVGRVSSWRALIGAAFDKGPGVVVFGQPFGSGFGRLEGGTRWVEFAPHNWYVSVFLRGGVIASVALVWFLIAVLRRSLALHDATWVAGAWVAVIVFGWGYSLPWYVFPALALALNASMVSRPPPRRSIRRFRELQLVRRVPAVTASESGP